APRRPEVHCRNRSLRLREDRCRILCRHHRHLDRYGDLLRSGRIPRGAVRAGRRASQDKTSGGEHPPVEDASRRNAFEKVLHQSVLELGFCVTRLMLQPHAETCAVDTALPASTSSSAFFRNGVSPSSVGTFRSSTAPWYTSVP